MMHYLLFQISPLFPKNFPDSVEISDDLIFLVIDYKFLISELFFAVSVGLHFPLFRENYYFPLLFQISPSFRKMYVFFTYFLFFVPPSLTMMLLQCTYWTPLIERPTLEIDLLIY